jgi:predicted transcriptional regulator
MPRQPKRGRSVSPLGETELEVLNHVWSLERATVSAVHERILRERKVAYTTVMTVMRKLASKGLLSVDESGQSYVYSAARPAEDVRGSLASDLVEKAFQGSASALVQALVRRERLSDEELAEIRVLLDEIGDREEDP